MRSQFSTRCAICAFMTLTALFAAPAQSNVPQQSVTAQSRTIQIADGQETHGRRSGGSGSRRPARESRREDRGRMA